MSVFDSPLNRGADERIGELLAERFPEADRVALERDYRDRMRTFPYRVSARPLLIDHAEFRALGAALHDLHGVLEFALELYREHREVRELFDVYREFEPLILDYTEVAPRAQACRFDGVWRRGGDFTIMETNAACPGGVVHIPAGTGAWTTTEWARLVLEGLSVEPYPTLADPRHFARTMLASAQRRGVEVSAAAIVKLGDAVSYDLDYILAAFRELGCRADLRDARDFGSAQGIPSVDGVSYQLVYSKAVPLDLLRSSGAAEFVRLLRHDEVFVVNSLAVQTVLEDKAVLALLSDPVYASLFSTAQRATVERHVPWTRLVRPGRTSDRHGDRVELLDHIARDREHLVLKPANLYAGIGVLVGPHVPPDQWSAGLAEAVRGRYVVQEFQPLPVVDVPAVGGPGLTAAYVDFSCFMFAGELAGLSSRCSKKPVVNISAGGECRVPVVPVAQAR
jgi:diaminobutyrate-2-oxoglutarate transaminase